MGTWYLSNATFEIFLAFKMDVVLEGRNKLNEQNSMILTYTEKTILVKNLKTKQKKYSFFSSSSPFVVGMRPII